MATLCSKPAVIGVVSGAVGVAALVVLRRLWPERAPTRSSEEEMEERVAEPLDPELVDWLQAQRLPMLGTRLALHGYTSLDLLGDLSAAETEELLACVQLRAGHLARLRRSLRQLQRSAAGSPCTGAAAQGEEAPCAPVASAACPDALPQDPRRGARQHAGAAAAAEEAPVRTAVRVLQPLEAEDRNDQSQSPVSASAAAASAAPTARVSHSVGGLSAGSRAVLHDLARRPDLNGRIGTLLAWDSQASRWEFLVDGSTERLKVRSENVREAPGGSSSSSSSVAPPARQMPEVPDEFRCCITKELMEQPVITSDGHTYERRAIAQWFEEHGTSPKTGQELTDKVLRPNHSMRAQILAWRERHGLPPQPPWEPEPQETVRTAAPQNQHGQPLPGAVPTVTVQTPAGRVTIPVAVLQGGVPGGHEGPMPPGTTITTINTSEASLMNILHLSPTLREDLLALLRGQSGDVVGEADLGGMDNEELVHITAQHPHLMEVVVRHLQSNPELMAQMGPGAGGAAGSQDSPVFRAAREGECGVVEQLLGSATGERLRQELSATGDSLLHVAAWCGHVRLTAMLLARGHPIQVPSRNRSTALHYAAFRGHVDVTRLLLEARADTERRMVGGDVAIHQAAWQGHAEVLRALLENRCDLYAVKDDGDTALSLAAMRGHVAACRELIAGASTQPHPEGVGIRNYRGRSPLHAAAFGGNAEVVKVLLTANLCVDSTSEREETPLHLAVQSGSAAVVEELLRARANVDLPQLGTPDEHSPLHMAVLAGSTRIMQFLLMHRASVEASRRDGVTPLHMAVVTEATMSRRPGEGSPIAALVAAQGDINTRARNGTVPLHTCLGPLPQAAQHRVVALRSLLESRADVESVLLRGERPLHLAVGANLHAEAALLIQHRACVNAARSDGCSPLHVAVSSGLGACIDLLLRAGADTAARNAAGHTAAEVARQCGRESLEHALLRQASGSRANAVVSPPAALAAVQSEDAHRAAPAVPAAPARPPGAPHAAPAAEAIRQALMRSRLLTSAVAAAETAVEATLAVPAAQAGAAAEAARCTWLVRAGLPDEEGEGMPALQAEQEGSTLESMRRAAERDPGCMGFAYHPGCGRWFPKRRGTGRPQEGALHQKHEGQYWECAGHQLHPWPAPIRGPGRKQDPVVTPGPALLCECPCGARRASVCRARLLPGTQDPCSPELRRRASSTAASPKRARPEPQTPPPTCGISRAGSSCDGPGAPGWAREDARRERAASRPRSQGGVPLAPSQEWHCIRERVEAEPEAPGAGQEPPGPPSAALGAGAAALGEGGAGDGAA
ncbi:unnamed protein product [Prorocentrum cordatum]|uniref:U-box domain-containing protein n=1 Tax=Prorocentrum cordatum TaxID=2364126 RepID=A0ABN9VFC9_9DINO|nr:unnamed protein product [Polarella glacialis]